MSMMMVMMNRMRSVLLFLFIISVSHAQDATSSIPPSSTPTALRSENPSVVPSQNPIAAPVAPSTAVQPTSRSPVPSNLPLFTSAPSRSQCTSNPDWRVEYTDYSGCTPKVYNLTCDHDLVNCWDYGNIGSATGNCCKCNVLCFYQCNALIYLPPPSTDYFAGDDCYGGGGGGVKYGDDDYYNDDDDGPSTFVLVVVMCIFVCCGIALYHQNGENQRNAPRDATQQTMAARRRQQRENNTTSQGLTEEERNHARYEIFLTKFHFQTVLPDKSNITATSMRSLASSKPDEEHQSGAHNHHDDDDASAVGGKETSLSQRKRTSLSERLSSWRRPSAKDECCICLECYAAGETICAPITTECNHVFHEGCINQWLKNNEKCPLCRVELLKD